MLNSLGTPPEYDQFVRLLPEFALDETQQVLLVHARTVVDVRVNLQDNSQRTAHQGEQSCSV